MNEFKAESQPGFPQKSKKESFATTVNSFFNGFFYILDVCGDPYFASAKITDDEIPLFLSYCLYPYNKFFEMRSFTCTC